MQTSRLLLLSLLCTWSVFANAQESRIKAIRVVPLYCYVDILRGYDSTCVNRVRITFKNSDEMKVHNMKFQLTITETSDEDSLTLYDARHEVSMLMKAGETYTADVSLINPISPPEGENSFSNRKAWKWEVTIINVNR